MDTIWKSINSSTLCKLHRNLNGDSFRHNCFTNQMLVKPNFSILYKFDRTSFNTEQTLRLQNTSRKKPITEYTKEVNGLQQN